MSRCRKCEEHIGVDVEICPICHTELVDQFPKMFRWTVGVVLTSGTAIFLAVHFLL